LQVLLEYDTALLNGQYASLNSLADYPKTGHSNQNLQIENGLLNTQQLQFSNEAARHKLLDLLGDLALVNKPIKGRIIATKPGHQANVAFAKELKKIFLEQKKLKGKPRYDPTIAAIYDATAIQTLLPHRHPFLLVDKIIELSDTHVVGIKNVTHDEYFFNGHFPNNPVMPGVLQLEALAQAGGILALSMQGTAYVGNKIVSEGELTARISKREPK